MRITKVFLLAGFVILYNCRSENIETAEQTNKNLSSRSPLNNEVPLLWNNGMSKRSWLFMHQETQKLYKNASNFWDADLVGNPAHHPDNKNEFEFKDGVSGEIFSVPGRHSPSVKWVTMGYKYSDWGQYPGYDMWIFDHNTDGSSASYEDPIEFRFMNHARGMNDTMDAIKSARKLREVGFVFDNWPQHWDNGDWSGGYHSFRGNYKVNEFSDIRLTFDAKMETYKKAYATNNTDPVNNKLGGYATADFRFTLFDNNGNKIKGFLIGVLFSNPENLDYNSNPNDSIIYEIDDIPNNIYSILLDGRKLGINCIDNISDINTSLSNSNEIYYLNQFKTVTIDYWSLIQTYFPNINYNNTIMTGLDIYNASRGSDITFSVKDIQLKGIN